MNSPYPQCILDDYMKAVDSIHKVDTVTSDVLAVLEAIEDAAEGDGRCDIIAGLARTARAHLASIEEASTDISEYCRAADVAHKGS